MEKFPAKVFTPRTLDAPLGRGNGTIDEANWDLDLTCGVAGAMLSEQTRLFKTELRLIQLRKRPIVISRYYDLTPVKVEFGALQEDALPHARFFRLLEGKWKSLTYADLEGKVSDCR